VRPFCVTLALALALGAAAGCEGDPHGLSWGIRFDEGDDRRRAVLVEATIVEGACDGPVRYETTFEVDAGAATMAPPNLAAGHYCLMGRARDASCTWFVMGRLELDLPADQTPQIVVLSEPATGSECPMEECEDGLCTGETLDAGMDTSTDTGTDTGTDTISPDTSLVDGCTPVGETCNGVDDDCDTVVDNGFDLMTDRNNCGSCGTVCTSDLSCVSGTCQCASPLTLDPPDRCRDITIDPSHCGMIGNQCDRDEWCTGSTCECRPGLTAAGGACRNLATDPQNCGAPGNDCSTMGAMTFCRGGTCVVACGTGETVCGNSCVDLGDDSMHCGSCGERCERHEVCDGGSCERYRVEPSCSSCPCDSLCRGDWDSCASYGTAIICHQD